MAYCEKDDLLTGDIPLAGKYGDGTKFVELAADEIDAQIGHIYETPIEIAVEGHPENRPSQLLLKKINTLLASGRIVLDMAAGGEDDRLHAYGASMVKEALGLLDLLTKQAIVLTGADKIESVDDDPNTAVSLIQEDPYSLVEGFYTRYGRTTVIPASLIPPSPMRPYDDRVI